MQTQYNPKETEDKWYKFWLEQGLFSAKSQTGRKPFTIVIPPPNITGILHMGHALNDTIQDVLVRFKRMQGYEVLWMPGTDHAGIATQNVVEKQLAKQGLKKEDVGRQEFTDRLWKWRQEYGSTIIEQLKKLGASCDWQRIRFTLDEGYSRAVKEVFIRLYKKGFIYRGNYIINWCPRCKTALSDEEAPYKEIDSFLYYINYPVEGEGKYITVATTRPETMLGDTAVAINPDDERYSWLKGKTVILPILNRRIRVIEDRAVDPEFGTGVVKVTPAHDPVDFAMAKRHNLEFINIMDDTAVLNENAGKFRGLDRFEGRRRLLEELEKEGLLKKKVPYKLNAGHCYRCGTIIEPRLSLQWFVKMKPLAEPAIKVVEEGRVKFYPRRWKKVYLNWMNNIQDWCISRQIWWGHRIPVWYCANCYDKNSGSDKGIVVSLDKPAKCPFCGADNLSQDKDVLDTWFSSWLWPFVTLGWPDKTKDLEFFYPTDALVTASEILFFWVARMIMASLEFMKDIPFRDVLIHGTVRDEKGVKMSKSLGNIIDPLEIIEKFGADALRFSLMMLASTGSDVFLSDEKFMVGRNYSNKIWNAARFIITNLEKNGFGASQYRISEYAKDFNLADKWILQELSLLISEAGRNLDKYRINDYAKSLYEFFWHKFCDWYIEIAKVSMDTVRCNVLFFVLEKFLRLLHPVMPFISEEIWQKLNKFADIGKSIVIAKWPKQEYNNFFDEKEIFDNLKDLIISARSFTRYLGIQGKPEFVFDSPDPDKLKTLVANLDWVKKLLKAEILKMPVKGTSFVLLPGCGFDIYLLTGKISNISEYKDKIKTKTGKLKKRIFSLSTKLSNPGFLQNAPEEVVSNAKESLAALKAELERIEKIKWG